MRSEDIQTGYEQTSFEMVAVGAGGKYEIPSAVGAHYIMDKEIDIQSFKRALDNHGYSFIAPYSEAEGHLTSKVYDAETNEFLHLKINTDHLRVFPKSEEFSLETFERLVKCIDTHITTLELESAGRNQ